MVDVLPFRYGFEGMRKGFFGEVFPPIQDRQRYPTMDHYIQTNFVGTWYRHWVGFSNTYLTLDKAWYCLDAYWQPPNMLYGQHWIWYMMMDWHEPSEYQRGRIMYFNGIRDMGVEPVYPARL